MPGLGFAQCTPMLPLPSWLLLVDVRTNVRSWTPITPLIWVLHLRLVVQWLLSMPSCPEAAHVTLSAALGKRQADFSHPLDAAGWEAQLASSSAMAKAGLLSEVEPGGRPFLTALPAGRLRCLRVLTSQTWFQWTNIQVSHLFCALSNITTRPIYEYA